MSAAHHPISLHRAGRLKLHLQTRVERCRLQGDARSEAEARLRLSKVARQLRDPARALSELSEALGLLLGERAWLACADVLLTSAEFLFQLHKIEDCQQNLGEARRLYINHGDAVGLGLTEILQADVHLLVGDVEAAFSSLLRSMDILTAIALPGPLAHVWIQLARVHHRRQEHRAEDAALSAAVEALTLYGKPRQAALCQLQRAQRLRQRHAHTQALEALQETQRRLGAAPPSPKIKVRVALERGLLLEDTGDDDGAERSLRRAAAGLAEVDEAALKADVVSALGAHLARRAQERGQLSHVELCLGRAIDISISLQDPQRILALAHILTETARRLGDLEMARRWTIRCSEAIEHLPPTDNKTH